MPLASAPPVNGQPPRRALAWLIGGVLMAHVWLLLAMAGALDFQLRSPATSSVRPLQTRMIAAAEPTTQARQASPSLAPRTRIAKKAAPEPHAAVPTPTAPTAADPSTEAVTQPPVDPTPNEALLASTTATPASVPTAEPAATVTTTNTAPPTAIPAGQSLPNIPLGALPTSSLLSYSLTGQEKGLTYYASGELRWQHNDEAYALSLSVKAFLVGSRQWRSTGDITTAGLAPRRFSDNWRSERASHFDREKSRVVFSSNAPEAPLLPGAQDQISLYVQLAAAMAGLPERFTPGTLLQIQTITLRDALPWTLTLEHLETLTLHDQTLPTAKWVCQPRNRFDSKVEFWVAEKHQWLPVRIRITQANGNFIDLNLRDHQALPALSAIEKTT